MFQKAKDEGPKKKKLPPMNLEATSTGSDELILSPDNQAESAAGDSSTTLKSSTYYVREPTDTGELYDLADPGNLPTRAEPTTAQEVMQWITTLAGEEVKLTTATELKAKILSKLQGAPVDQLVAHFKTGLDLLDRTTSDGQHAKLSEDPLLKFEDTLRLATNAHRELQYSMKSLAGIFVSQPELIVNAFVSEVLRRFARHPAAMTSVHGLEILHDEMNRARVTFLRGTPTGLRTEDREDEGAFLHDPSVQEPVKPKEEAPEAEAAPEVPEEKPAQEAPKESKEDEVEKRLKEKRARLLAGSDAYRAGQAAQVAKADMQKKAPEEEPQAAPASPLATELSGIGELKVSIKRDHRKRMEDCTPTDAIKTLMKKLKEVKPHAPVEGQTRAGFVSSDAFVQSESDRTERYKQNLVYDAMNGLQAWIASEVGLLNILGQPVNEKSIQRIPSGAEERLSKIQARVQQSKSQRDQIRSIVTTCVTALSELVKPNVETASGLSANEQLRLIDFASPGMSRIRIERTSHINEELWHDARRGARKREREITDDKNKQWLKFGDDATP